MKTEKMTDKCDICRRSSDKLESCVSRTGRDPQREVEKDLCQSCRKRYGFYEPRPEVKE